jgi:hypothetical protein
MATCSCCILQVSRNLDLQTDDTYEHTLLHAHTHLAQLLPAVTHQQRSLTFTGAPILPPLLRPPADFLHDDAKRKLFVCSPA